VKDGFSQYIEMVQTPKTPMKLPIYEPCYFVGSLFFRMNFNSVIFNAEGISIEKCVAKAYKILQSKVI
jgi:hypothetical protein